MARRAETGVSGDEVFGAHRQRVEVDLQRRGEVRVGERITTGDEPGDPAGRGPVDRVGHPTFDLAGVVHLRGRPLVSSLPTFVQ